MTSISQPVVPNQLPSSASQQPSAPAHSRASSQAAGSGSAGNKTSYASATKKPFSPPPASSSSNQPPTSPAQHGKSGTTSPINGKMAIPPAVPTVGTSTVVNGNTPTSSSSGAGDLGRKPSVTISASGPPQYAQNGASVGVKGPAGSGIQFGSYNPDGSPRITNATLPHAQQSSSSLGVHNSSNPRITSPANSPSPIPQPPASGGKPPSHGQNLSVSFGNSGGPDQNLRPAIPSGPLASGAQHLRRESSHSQHSDMSGHGMGPGAGRGGYAVQGGRGRGYGGSGQYSQQMPYSPQPGYRQTPPSQPGSRAGMPPFQPQQQPNRPYGAYPNSPRPSTHSPVPPNAQPVHPQQAQMSMQNPQMNYGYGPPGQYGPYTNMAPSQSYNMANAYLNDPAYQNQAYYYFNTYGPSMQPVPSQSPRPPHQMQPSAPQGYGGQYPVPVPQSMSRTSSAVSGVDRPGSGLGLPQQTGSTPAPAGGIVPPPSTQPNPSPAPKASSSNAFEIPKKKSTSIVIRNPDSGDIVDLKKASASPAPSSKSPANASAAPTPPPRVPSQDSHHVRTESKSIKTDEEKRAEMKETIARKVEADKLVEQRKKDEALAAQQKEPEPQQKKEREEEEEEEGEGEEQVVKPDAPAAVAQPEEASQEAPIKEAAKDGDKPDDVEDEAAKKAREAQELEDQIAQWEAEAAEAERKEREAEKAYAAKKQAEKDEAARKEAEAFKMDEEEMKRAEREAEEAEEARTKQTSEQESSESQKYREDAWAALKRGGESLTPSSDTPAAQDTPQDSDVATPVSEVSTAPPKAPAGGKQKPAALKLETSKSVEPPQPTPQLLSLRSARKLTSITDISYPPQINSPNPALNTAAPPGRFKYDRDFLLQFQRAFTEKPSENWTERVKETLGDTTEPASARGSTPARGGSTTGSMGLGGRQNSNRAPLPQMGAFGQTGRTLPPGTTSQSRFEAATRGGRPATQTIQNPLAGFVSRPGGAFPQPPGSIKMDRTPSSTSLAHPNSPRNASQRGGSQRGSRAGGRREDPKDNKTMPLTAGAQVKPIEITASGWKPRSVGSGALAGPTPGGDGLMAPDVVQRKVKSNLNKMTPNNFDKISGQILEIAHQSKHESDGRSLRQVIQLTFEKATDEAHWAEMYAQFCHRMLESMSLEIKDESIRDKKGEVVAGGHLFRKYLLTRCQTEFERGWKVNLPEKPEGETEEAAMLSDAYYTAAAAKRRGLGLVRFIGELYKLGMLTERIMHECVKKLVDYEGLPDEAEIESLTSLLKTIGQQLDGSDKGHGMMDAYFVRINQMVELPDLPSRLRFMLMDIVDLRKANWHSKTSGVTGPVTLDAVRSQVAETERQKEAQRVAENTRRGGGRLPIGRGDARAFSGGQQFGMPPPDYHGKTVGVDDLKRLGSKGASRQFSSQGPTFGPTSMFNSARGSNTRKPLNIAQKDDSGASSRVSTPPAQKEKERKEEQEAKKSANAFSVLGGLESAEAADSNASPASSPPTAQSQPAIDRSKSPSNKDSPSKKDASEAS